MWVIAHGHLVSRFTYPRMFGSYRPSRNQSLNIFISSKTDMDGATFNMYSVKINIHNMQYEELSFQFIHGCKNMAGER